MIKHAMKRAKPIRTRLKEIELETAYPIGGTTDFIVTVASLRGDIVLDVPGFDPVAFAEPLTAEERAQIKTICFNALIRAIDRLRDNLERMTTNDNQKETDNENETKEQS